MLSDYPQYGGSAPLASAGRNSSPASFSRPLKYVPDSSWSCYRVVRSTNAAKRPRVARLASSPADHGWPQVRRRHEP